MNEQGVRQIFEENDVIKEEKIRKLMHECWDLNFQFWGEDNFKRWIDNSVFPNRIKNIAITEFIKEKNLTEKNEDELLLDELNNLMKKNKILNVNINETNYFIENRKRVQFINYLNEGLKVFLNLNCRQNKFMQYYSSVQLVKLLYYVLGDFFIKCYLSNNVDNEKFVNKLSSLVSNNGKSNILALRNFYNDLEEAYKYLYTNEKVSKKDLKRTNTNIQKSIQNIVVNYFSNKIDDLEYYNDEKIDFNKVSEDLKFYVQLAKDANMVKLDFENISFENEIYERVLEKLIEHSHLVVEVENKKQIIDDIIKKIFCRAEYKENKLKKMIKTDAWIIADKAGRSLNKEKNVAFKLAEIQLSKNENVLENKNFSIAEFMSVIANIKEKTNMSNLEVDNILGNYLIKYCSNQTNIKIIESVIKSKINIILNISKIRKEQEKDVIESKFLKLDNGKFIEKRDGQFYYLDITQKGNVREKKVILDSATSILNNIKLNDLKSFKNGVTVYKVQSENIKIITDKLMDKAIVIYRNGNIKKTVKIIENIKYVMDEIIYDALKDKMELKKYYANNLENNMEIVQINFSKFSTFLKSILDVIPDNKKDDFVKESVVKLLNFVFKIEEDNYKKIYNKIEDLVKLLIKENTNKRIEVLYGELDKSVLELNNLVNKHTDKLYKYGLMGYRDLSKNKKFILNINEIKKKQLENEMNDFINNFNQYVIEEKFIDETADFPGLVNISNIYCCVKRNIDVCAMTMDIKSLLNNYSKDEYENKFNEISKNLILKLYGQDNKEADRMQIYNEMQNILKIKVIDNGELDVDRFKELQNNLYEINEQEYKNIFAKNLKIDDFLNEENIKEDISCDFILEDIDLENIFDNSSNEENYDIAEANNDLGNLINSIDENNDLENLINQIDENNELEDLISPIDENSDLESLINQDDIDSIFRESNFDDILDDDFESLLKNTDFDALFESEDIANVAELNNNNLDSLIKEVVEFEKKENIPVNIKKLIIEIIRKSNNDKEEVVEKKLQLLEKNEIKYDRKKEEAKKRNGLLNEIVSLTKENCSFSQIYDAMDIIRKTQTENLLKKYNP